MRDEEADLEIGRGKQDDDGVTGCDPFAGTVECVMDEAVGWRADGLLVYGPAGAVQGGGEGFEFGFGGADFIGAAAQFGGLEVGEQLIDPSLVEVALGLGAFEFLGSDDAFVDEFRAASEFGFSEVEGLAGMIELGLERGDFGGSLTLAEVLEVCAGAGEALFGLSLIGAFGVHFEGIEVCASGDGLSAGDGEGLKVAGERGSYVDVFSFDVALKRVGRRRGAAEPG